MRSSAPSARRDAARAECLPGSPLQRGYRGPPAPGCLPARFSDPEASGRVGLAEKQVRGQYVQRLELALDVAEDPLQILQDPTRELVHEEGAPRLQHLAGLT